MKGRDTKRREGDCEFVCLCVTKSSDREWSKCVAGSGNGVSEVGRGLRPETELHRRDYRRRAGVWGHRCAFTHLISTRMNASDE